MVILLILLFLMLAFSIANQRALSNLHKEIQAVEKQQQKKYAVSPNNAAAPAPRP